MDSYGFFWNSNGGDRKYSADSMSDWLRKFFTTGVFNGDLQVTATSGMGISVGSGYANIKGKVVLYKNPQAFTLDVAYASVQRIDTVVVERNDVDRSFYIKVIKGSSNGQPTAPVRNTTVYQLVIAQITVPAGATSITQSSITDTRMNSSLCGWVASTVTEINYDQAMAQFTAWFEEYKQEIIHEFDDEGAIAQAIFEAWFEGIRGQLDSDAAGHLQLEVNDLSTCFANEYLTTENYDVGDTCMKDNRLWRCINPTSGEFNSWDWTHIQIMPVIEDLNSSISNMDTRIDNAETKADGFEGSTTTFNSNGSITETFSDRVVTTVFNSNGSITETMSKNGSVVSTKTTTFNNDGSITVTVV